MKIRPSHGFLFATLIVLLSSCATPTSIATDLPQQSADELLSPSAPAKLEAEIEEQKAAEAIETGEEGPVVGGILVRAMTSEPARIDPQGTASSGLSLVLPYLFDTLVSRDVDNQIRPQLAERWEVSENGLEITFHLKEGTTFHDGTPLNAEAVRFTFERFKESGTRSPIYGGVMQISDIEVVDELIVRFVFDQPAANFWSTITMPYAGIISPESVRKFEETGKGHVIGSGPFRLESWQAGISITLTRNEDYQWGPEIVTNQGPPHLDRLIYKVIPDETTQLAALQSGEVDVIFINQPSHKSQLQDDPDIRLEDSLLSGLVYLGFNCQKSPFDEVLVRQALSHAIDKEQIVAIALGGIGQVATAPLPPTLPGYDPSLEDYALAFNPDKARDGLLQAGFTRTSQGGWEREGASLEGLLLTSTRAPNEAIATLIQSQLAEIGIPIQIQQLDSRAVMQATSEGQFDLLLWRYEWNDPDGLQIFLSSDRIGRTNRVAYGNSKVDSFLELGSQEMDDHARLQFYIEAQKIILQEAPWQPLYYPVDVIAIRDHVIGAQIGSMGRLLLNDIQLITGE